jgi:hypothetical protein
MQNTMKRNVARVSNLGMTQIEQMRPKASDHASGNSKKSFVNGRSGTGQRDDQRSHAEKRFVDLPAPVANDGQVLVRMRTVGINPLDNTFRSGHHYAATLENLP